MIKSTPCTGKDCPICKMFGPPDTVYITIRDQKTGESQLLKVKKSWALERGLIPKENGNENC